MEIRDLIGALRRFKLLAALILALAIVLGIAAAYLPKQRYRSTATMIVNPASQRIDFNTADTIRFLLPSVSAQANTATFANEVRARIPNVPWENITLITRDEPGTSILKVQVDSYDPSVAAAIANAAAQTLISRRISGLIKIQLLDPARPSFKAVSPNRPLILFAATVIGLIAGVLSALGANAVFPRVRSSAEIRRRFGLEVIGEIPNSRSFPKQASRLFDPAAGKTELVEAFQRLRATFEIVSAGRNVIGVTSCTAGEGKSAVTANLAYAIASMGEQVVVVDTDLRRSTLHEYFAVRSGMGVADVPLGAEIDRLVQPTDLPNLRVLPAGLAVQHPTSILHNAYPQILDSFDDSLVIVDMPPILGAADAVLVATMTKAVILVTDARHGDPGELEQVLHELDRAHAQVLGVVLNRASIRRSTRTDVYYAQFAQRQAATKRKGLAARLFPVDNSVQHRALIERPQRRAHGGTDA
jgi:capsular exopolysaccharide synthesis family protein